MKAVQIKQEPMDDQTPSQASIDNVSTIPSLTYQPIKVSQSDIQHLTSQPIQIQMSQSNTMQAISTASAATTTISTSNQPQILQLPSIVSSSQNTVAYNQTTTQATKTTFIKAVTSADGNTVYTIPSNLIFQQPNFITTNAQGELQLGGIKIENAPSHS